MPRLNVYVPDDLSERVKELLPDLNVSAVLQQALRQMLECHHDRAVCADCGEPVPGGAEAGEALEHFYADLRWEWQALVDKGGTAEGAARMAKAVAVRHGVPGAEKATVPRPARPGRRRRAA